MVDPSLLNEKSVIILGPPGSGKSALCCTLLDGNPDSKRFKSEEAPGEGGVTRDV